MLLREVNESREHRDLAGYALKSSESRGRKHRETMDKFRPVFLRDRDRVIHSAAFRRLEYKTQVFVNNEGDYYRTRLTHTLEVAQIARSAAYSLKLNEGFVEALSLAHDLGHPPFGHAGEEILNRLMKSFGGFEHNRQGLRIVDILEKRYPDFNGLNLTHELRESILKHDSDIPPEEFDLDKNQAYTQPYLEAQVVDLADRAAYTHHDLDDGLQAGILNADELREVPLWRRALDDVNAAFPECSGRIRLHQVTNTVVKWFIDDLILNSSVVLKKAAPNRAEDARCTEEKMVCFSPSMEKACGELTLFLNDNFYKHDKVIKMVARSERILSDLFHGYLARPETLPRDFKRLADDLSIERAVCDYIAGMTDRFAEEEWRRLYF